MDFREGERERTEDSFVVGPTKIMGFVLASDEGTCIYSLGAAGWISMSGQPDNGQKGPQTTQSSPSFDGHCQQFDRWATVQIHHRLFHIHHPCFSSSSTQLAPSSAHAAVPTLSICIIPIHFCRPHVAKVTEDCCSGPTGVYSIHSIIIAQ